MNQIITYIKVVAFAPLLNVMLLGLMILQAYLEHGHFPSYDNPDPKELGALYYLYVCGELLVVMSLFTVPIYVLYVYTQTKKIPWQYVLVFVLGLLAVLTIFRIEGPELGEWIVD